MNCIASRCRVGTHTSPHFWKKHKNGNLFILLFFYFGRKGPARDTGGTARNAAAFDGRAMAVIDEDGRVAVKDGRVMADGRVMVDVADGRVMVGVADGRVIVDVAVGRGVVAVGTAVSFFFDNTTTRTIIITIATRQPDTIPIICNMDNLGFATAGEGAGARMSANVDLGSVTTGNSCCCCVC